MVSVISIALYIINEQPYGKFFWDTKLHGLIHKMRFSVWRSSLQLRGQKVVEIECFSSVTTANYAMCTELIR